jgi:hypothetical protein
MWEWDILEVFLLNVQYMNSSTFHPEAALSQSTPATSASAIAQAFVTPRSLVEPKLG